MVARIRLDTTTPPALDAQKNCTKTWVMLRHNQLQLAFTLARLFSEWEDSKTPNQAAHSRSRPYG